ncbi:TIGR02300 family protein [Phenylobacterium sp. J367]|uniref:TIGR02300 family protein n=1 Tax=Phenylobacterium sp. J367 TaxID=2898435 RepID=UPI0027E32479|nr:TIGR02300 family protein [Phenylobacterium sp. J367]
MSARCEIDLSPGARTVPLSGPPRRALKPCAAMPEIRASACLPFPRGGIALTAAPPRGKGARFSKTPCLKEGRLPWPILSWAPSKSAPHCQAKFYDLNKRPAHCPKCGTDFDPDEAVRNRRVRARAIVPEADTDDERESQVRGKDTESEDEEEDDAVTPELDEVVDEPPLPGDDDEDGADPVATPPADDLGEFSDDEEVEDDADVPFLEEDDEDFDDSEIEGLPDEGDVDDR